ncbi:hypothetical protein JW930_01475 [Candidatus Woesearchaeota archaeon]|nr:hypothetical protein [Candidatus Woesearchaeota archaeon]
MSLEVSYTRPLTVTEERISLNRNLKYLRILVQLDGPDTDRWTVSNLDLFTYGLMAADVPREYSDIICLVMPGYTDRYLGRMPDVVVVPVEASRENIIVSNPKGLESLLTDHSLPAIFVTEDPECLDSPNPDLWDSPLRTVLFESGEYRGNIQYCSPMQLPEKLSQIKIQRQQTAASPAAAKERTRSFQAFDINPDDLLTAAEYIRKLPWRFRIVIYDSTFTVDGTKSSPTPNTVRQQMSIGEFIFGEGYSHNSVYSNLVEKLRERELTPYEEFLYEELLAQSESKPSKFKGMTPSEALLESPIEVIRTSSGTAFLMTRHVTPGDIYVVQGQFPAILGIKEGGKTNIFPYFTGLYPQPFDPPPVIEISRSRTSPATVPYIDGQSREKEMVLLQQLTKVVLKIKETYERGQLPLPLSPLARHNGGSGKFHLPDGCDRSNNVRSDALNTIPHPYGMHTGANTFQKIYQTIKYIAEQGVITCSDCLDTLTALGACSIGLNEEILLEPSVLAEWRQRAAYSFGNAIRNSAEGALAEADCLDIYGLVLGTLLTNQREIRVPKDTPQNYGIQPTPGNPQNLLQRFVNRHVH